MLNSEITVIAVEDTFVPNDKGGYNKLAVTYKTIYKGMEKTDTKKIMSFVNKEVYDALKNAGSGSKWTISSEKEGEYRVWKAAVQSNGGSQGSSSTTASKSTPVSSRGDWETSEERARKQVYIIKQSSITSAIALLKTDKKATSLAEVLDTAQKLTDFVLGKETPQEAATSAMKAVIDLTDDVPL